MNRRERLTLLPPWQGRRQTLHSCFAKGSTLAKPRKEEWDSLCYGSYRVTQESRKGEVIMGEPQFQSSHLHQDCGTSRHPRPSEVSRECQFNQLVESGQPLSPVERFVTKTRYRIRYLLRITQKIIANPLIIPKKIRERLRARLGHQSTSAPVIPPPLGLQSGDLVRVKSADEIRATLDKVGKCQGLDYMAWAMDGFCGRQFTVKKRITRFFDERHQRMLKLRDVVILDGVYCEPDPTLTFELADCQKTCFLFWKEAWLERLP